ncbi:MAG TPA: ABC transporter permease [Bryobacteraceae bacterium]|nr:ABC transporter permease [Bryobacteraceae bacterium]
MSRRWIHILPLRLRSMFRRSQVERELDEELRFHLEARIQHEIAAKRTPEEARHVAMRAMEGLEQRKEECRDTRHMSVIEGLVRDARYAFRTLARSPGFTLTALLALALGIGANTAVFSVVNTVLLRPLPYVEPDRLVMLFNSRPLIGTARGSASLADYLDWRKGNQSFESLDIFEINAFTNGRFTWTSDGGEPTQVVGFRVSATFFETFGVRPLIGNGFAAGDDEPGKPDTVVVSEGLWRRRYGASREVIGKQVLVNGSPHTITGVMPGSFEFWQRDVDAWAIYKMTPPTRRGPFFLRGVARLKRGVTIEQAYANMTVIARNVERANAPAFAGLRYSVLPIRDVVVGDARPLLWVLSGSVLLVFLIAVFNVANLTLARATTRQREIAVRLSIGAGRGQLVRQFLTESLVLSLAGGLIGVALAQMGVTLLHSLNPRELPRLSEIAVDERVLGFTLLASLTSAILFGLAPALIASGTGLSERLKDGGRGGESRGRGRARGALVVAQVALCVLLLIGAGLLIRSFDRLGKVRAGFDAPPERVVTMFVSPTGPRITGKPEALAAFWRQVIERIRELPGVEAAGVSNALPPDRPGYHDTYEIEGKPLAPGSQHPIVPMPFVSPDYFRALGIPLLRGRTFDSSDYAGPGAAVISETMARLHFPGEDPIGKRIRYGNWLEIVGVVGDVKYGGLAGESKPVFYQLITRGRLWDVWLTVRTKGDTGAVASAIREEIRRIDPVVPVDRISTLAQSTAESVALPRFRSLLMTVFAASALLLAAIGIYGVVAYSVAQRTQEIGIRMALGATQRSVLRDVIGRGSRLAVVGIAVGLAGAFGLTRVLQRMLFGVTPSDLFTFIATALVLGAVAVAASLIPAWRAARIDPVTALRQE